MSPLIYRAYAKNNLLQITIYKNSYDFFVILRFTRAKEGGGYDTQNNIAIKYTLFDFNALSFALEEASYNEGSANYIKYSDPTKGGAQGAKKQVTIARGYLNLQQSNKLISIRLTRYEMRALAYEIRKLCDMMLQKLVETNRKDN